MLSLGNKVVTLNKVHATLRKVHRTLDKVHATLSKVHVGLQKCHTNITHYHTFFTYASITSLIIHYHVTSFSLLFTINGSRLYFPNIIYFQAFLREILD